MDNYLLRLWRTGGNLRTHNSDCDDPSEVFLTIMIYEFIIIFFNFIYYRLIQPVRIMSII